MSDLFKRIPIIYSDDVNVRLYYLQNLHSFDACKFEKIYALLKEKLGNKLFISESKLPVYIENDDEMLKMVHDDKYIEWSKTREGLAQICEMSFINTGSSVWGLNGLLDYLFLDKLRHPMITHVKNTIIGAFDAVKYGSAICLSGGMHHASKSYGTSYLLKSRPWLVCIWRYSNCIQLSSEIQGV